MTDAGPDEHLQSAHSRPHYLDFDPFGYLSRAGLTFCRSFPALHSIHSPTHSTLESPRAARTQQSPPKSKAVSNGWNSSGLWVIQGRGGGGRAAPGRQPGEKGDERSREGTIKDQKRGREDQGNLQYCTVQLERRGDQT